jgi:hypothetical protein
MVALFILEHINQQVSVPYYKDQNGQDEQDIQNVMDQSRSPMTSPEVPHYVYVCDNML